MIVTLATLFLEPLWTAGGDNDGRRSATQWDAATESFLRVRLPTQPPGSVERFCHTGRFDSARSHPGTSPLEPYTKALRSTLQVLPIPASDLPGSVFPGPFGDGWRNEQLESGMPDPQTGVDRQVLQVMQALGCDGLVVSEVSETRWSVQVYTHRTVAIGSGASIASADYLLDPDWTAIGQRAGRAVIELARHRTPIEPVAPVEPGDPMRAPTQWCDRAPAGKVCAVKVEGGLILVQHDQLRFVYRFDIPDLHEELQSGMVFVDPIPGAIPFMDAPGRHMRLGTVPAANGIGPVWIHHDRRLIVLGYGSVEFGHEIRLPAGAWVRNDYTWLYVGVPGPDGTTIHALDDLRAGPRWIVR